MVSFIDSQLTFLWVCAAAVASLLGGCSHFRFAFVTPPSIHASSLFIHKGYLGRSYCEVFRPAPRGRADAALPSAPHFKCRVSLVWIGVSCPISHVCETWGFIALLFMAFSPHGLGSRHLTAIVGQCWLAHLPFLGPLCATDVLALLDLCEKTSYQGLEGPFSEIAVSAQSSGTPSAVS